MSPRRSVLFRLALACALAAGVAACGRKGALDPPPAAAAAPAQQGASAPEAKPPTTPPNRPFLLDPLLN